MPVSWEVTLKRVFREKIWYPLFRGVIFSFPVPILQIAGLSPSFFSCSGVRTYTNWSVCQSSAVRTQKQIPLDFSHTYPSLPQVCLAGALSLLMFFSYPIQHHSIARLDQRQSSTGICVQQYHADGWAFTVLVLQGLDFISPYWSSTSWHVNKLGFPT